MVSGLEQRVRPAANGSVVEGYDIIGDVHGCATQLEELLGTLGYRPEGDTGGYRHPSRQAIFVGDLIDAGDEQLRVLQIVKAMVDASAAQITMGNHEFNALAYHTEWPPGSGKYLRANGDPANPWSEKNTKQHQAFLDQVTGEDRRIFLQWFKTLPLWLDLGEVRVVHACWHDESIALVQQRCGSNMPFGELKHLVDANAEGDPLHTAVEILLKGPEINLVEHGQPEYRDKYGFSRDNARVRWWNSNARTLRDLAVMDGNFTTEDGDPYPPLPEKELAVGDQSFVYAEQVPVFYGHYWRKGPPQHGSDYTDYTACVDFSAVKGGALTAYRWSGEKRIASENFVAVDR